MAYVIAEPCIGTEDTGASRSVLSTAFTPPLTSPTTTTPHSFIDPEECIDCDACVEACPVDACFAEDQLPPEWEGYTALNEVSSLDQ